MCNLLPYNCLHWWAQLSVTKTICLGLSLCCLSEDAIHCCGRSKWEIQTVSTEIWSFQFFDHCRILSVLTRKSNFGPGHIFSVFAWWIKSDRSFYSGMRLPISKTKKWSNTSCFLQRRKTHREYEIKVGQNLVTETKSESKTVLQTSKVLAITMEIWERDQTLQCCFSWKHSRRLRHGEKQHFGDSAAEKHSETLRPAHHYGFGNERNWRFQRSETLRWRSRGRVCSWSVLISVCPGTQPSDAYMQWTGT
jgi:hypothetical protein